MAVVAAFMWWGIAVFLLRLGIKENKIYLIFSVYFVFNGIWWIVSAYNSADMFHGSLGIIYRAITAVFLVIGCVFYYLYKTKNTDKNNNEK